MSYRMRLAPYIHQNPQKHRLIDDFRDWPWSSFHAFGSQKDSNIARDPVLDWYGGLEGFMAAHTLLDHPQDEAFDPLQWIGYSELDRYDDLERMIK